MENNRENSTLAVCAYCGNPLEDGDVFCTTCGHEIAHVASATATDDPKIDTSHGICVYCGAPLDDEDAFCPTCGKKTESVVVGDASVFPNEEKDKNVVTDGKAGVSAEKTDGLDATKTETNASEDEGELTVNIVQNDTNVTKPSFAEKMGLNNPVVKWTLIIVGIFTVVMIAIALIINAAGQCAVAGCNKKSLDGGSYCSKHTCSVYNCYEKCKDGYSRCERHQDEYEEEQRKAEEEEREFFASLAGTWQSVYLQTGNFINGGVSSPSYTSSASMTITSDGTIDGSGPGGPEQLYVYNSDSVVSSILGYNGKVAGRVDYENNVSLTWRLFVDDSGDLHEMSYGEYFWTYTKFRRVSTSNNSYTYTYDNTSSQAAHIYWSKTGIATDALNVRRDPSTKNERVGLLKKGTSVTIVGESGDFWEIEYSWSADGKSGSTAYVHKDYIRIEEADDDNYSVYATQRMSGIATDALNVRRDPSTRYDRVGTLKKGTRMTIVGESGDFWEIEYAWSAGGQSGSTAFVHKDYVSISQSGNAAAQTTKARSAATTRGYSAQTTKRNTTTTRAGAAATTRKTTARTTTAPRTTAPTTRRTTKAPSSQKGLEIAADRVSGYAGERVKVNFYVDYNSGFWGTSLDVKYDSSILTVESVQFGSNFSGVSFLPVSYGADPFTINGVWNDIDSNCTATGVLATATFTISPYARAGAKSDISITFEPNNQVDAAMNDVPTTVHSGSVIVVG